MLFGTKQSKLIFKLLQFLQFPISETKKTGTLIKVQKCITQNGKEKPTIAFTCMAENLRYVDSVQTPSLKGRVECELASSDYYTYYTANFSSSVGEIQSQCLENIGPFYAYPAIIDSVNIYKTYGLKCNQAKGCNLELPVRGICPEGWHVPSTDDWKVLASYAGLENDGSSFGFDKKSSPLMSRIGWFADRSNDDPYGFSAIIAGYDNGKMHGYQFAYYTTQKSEYMNLKHVRCLKD